ncbi:GNAT family N-acetyltransferase [Alphaproteobacteria bacterium]|nr:GNAT family N-acetyltransferase [Alphaproteobacteria bacterium]
MLTLNKISTDQYNDVLNDKLFGTASIYHSLEWLSVVAKCFKYDISYYSICEAGSAPLAVFPVFERRLGSLLIRGSPLRGTHTEFGGLFLRGNIEEQIIFECFLKYEAFFKKGAYFEYCLDFFDPKTSRLLDRTASEDSVLFERKTSLVDLNKTIGEIWTSFNGNTRNMIRKAQKKGFETQVCEATNSRIDHFYELLQKSFRKSGQVSPHPISFYKELFSSGFVSNVLLIEASSKNGGVSYGIFLIDRDRMRFLSGASNKLALLGAGSSVVLWDAIQIAKNLGLNIFDLGGLGIPSIDRFKKGFGGQEVSYTWVRGGTKIVVLLILIYQKIKTNNWFRVSK